MSYHLSWTKPKGVVRKISPEIGIYLSPFAYVMYVNPKYNFDNRIAAGIQMNFFIQNNWQVLVSVTNALTCT